MYIYIYIYINIYIYIYTLIFIDLVMKTTTDNIIFLVSLLILVNHSQSWYTSHPLLGRRIARAQYRACQSRLILITLDSPSESKNFSLASL